MNNDHLKPERDESDNLLLFNQEHQKHKEGMKREKGYYNNKDSSKSIVPYRIKQRGNHMDEATKTIFDRLDKDIRDHKQEVRERDARILADAQEREKRYREEAKEREERMIGVIREMKVDINTKLTSIEAKVDSTYKYISNMTIAVIIGIAAIVITAIIAVLAK